MWLPPPPSLNNIESKTKPGFPEHHYTILFISPGNHFLGFSVSCLGLGTSGTLFILIIGQNLKTIVRVNLPRKDVQ